ncbi:putative ribosomal RNA large subunit methyltransferase FTSJ1 [Toxoplasma gondii GT1]|uniref:Putative tRNA (cytidine(32)/guanosine(34)-2'-O)-methyltransferase n=3 Tax=Toxoplasma gondii TaxID=5811 RepID=S7UXG4_TOXGG|nr:putative ribosomal RNA large subunit methyltransferase FTSJ1 [Toxoplasma gondii GT1]KAF4640924.1 putative ribosomal RNA large subunit methyltransferase FTSJ1 [Toxoplasma gondii]RQX71012.1 putative ribosomal RNA large subunit methyltransferase FTSJ1 [Toxoplasma gondii CAST]
MGKLSKDRRDIYYRRAKEEGYRARSAYKLLQLDDELHFLSPPSLSRRRREGRNANGTSSLTEEETEERETRNCGDGKASRKNAESLCCEEEEEEREEEEREEGEEEGEEGEEEGEEEDVYPVRAVDLCAAPGSWSQVLRRRLRDNFRRKLARYEKQVSEQARDSGNSPSSTSSSSLSSPSLRPPAPPLIVAVDLQEMAPIPGVHTLQADITHESTVKAILDFFAQQPADLVVCDGAPDVTGMHDIDEFIQAQLLFAALRVACKVLKPGGVFVCKAFRGEQIPLVYVQLKTLFAEVRCCKPAASRNSSIEAFLVCKGFEPLPVGLDACIAAESGDDNREQDSEQEAAQGCLVPFLSCGDLAGYDADRNYPVDDRHVFLPPTQPPVHPPYEQALHLKRGSA